MIIIGIDPGSVSCGLSVIKSEGSQFSLVAETTIKLKGDFPMRLATLRTQAIEFLTPIKNAEVSIERVFTGINPASLIKLAQARGVLLETMASLGFNIFEYSPREIKKAVSISGSLPKEQIKRIISSILGID